MTRRIFYHEVEGYARGQHTAAGTERQVCPSTPLHGCL